MNRVQRAAEQTFREHSGRVLATLIRQLGDFTLAEDAVQEAFESALATWPARGVPGESGRLDHGDRSAEGDRPAAPRRDAGGQTGGTSGSGRAGLPEPVRSGSGPG